MEKGSFCYPVFYQKTMMCCITQLMFTDSGANFFEGYGFRYMRDVQSLKDHCPHLSVVAEHDIIWHGIPLWSVWVSCLGYVTSLQPLAHLQPISCRVENREGLDAKNCGAKAKTLVCYQNCFGHLPNTQHYTDFCEEN